MDTAMQKWRRSVIRNSLDRYRDAMEHYYVRTKRVVDLGDGIKAFSLLSPPFGSPAAQRRVRFIMKNVLDPRTTVSQKGAVAWGRRTPHFLTLAVTYRCQCDCAHCSAHQRRERMDRAGDALTVKELRKVILQAVALGTTCVILTGGEPLLQDGLCDLIASVPPEKAICSIFTNGEYLSAETVRRLKAAGLFGVFVSLDHSDGATHDRHRRRPGLQRTALDGLRRCQDAGLLTGLSSVITRENVASGELDAMMELGRVQRVIEVFLFDVIATGRLAGESCMLGPEDVERVKAFRQRYNELSDYPRIIHQTMFTSIAYPCAAEGCPAGVAQLHVMANGDVAPCDFTPYAFGNVRERPLSHIWRTITQHPLYAGGSPGCRLASPEYWSALAAAARPA